MALYDTLGATYGRRRQPDPRIAAQIHAALGDAADVINEGAGTGSYEPPQTALAVEPSQVMIAQRLPGAAPAVRAVAERLPVRDKAADAVMALLTIHHWTDLAAGIAELRRVARRRIVILTWDQQIFRDRFWLVHDYLPQAAAFDDTHALPMDRLAGLLGGARRQPVPVPHDCTDRFAAAYWRRPHAYLDPPGTVRDLPVRPDRRSGSRTGPGSPLRGPDNRPLAHPPRRPAHPRHAGRRLATTDSGHMTCPDRGAGLN